MLFIDDATPVSANLMMDFWEKDRERAPFYRRQAELNPIPDVLVWQELKGRTRVISLPTLAEIDQSISRDQQRASEANREAAAFKEQQAGPKR